MLTTLAITSRNFLELRRISTEASPPGITLKLLLGFLVATPAG